jgi:NAD(P)-dependent dehydrogenase (short-subunit alcohol dehydrogenase family)
MPHGAATSSSTAGASSSSDAAGQVRPRRARARDAAGDGQVDRRDDEIAFAVLEHAVADDGALGALHHDAQPRLVDAVHDFGGQPRDRRAHALERGRGLARARVADDQRLELGECLGHGGLERDGRTPARARCTESARLAGSCNQSPARGYRSRSAAAHDGALSTKGSIMSKTWFITGATRGLGADIAAAALKAGDRVVATGRQRAAVSDRLGPDGDRLLSQSLDVSDAAQATAAVAAAVQRFGTIDVLVNNAGYGHIGYFEEASAADIEAQYATNVFGLFNVTRAALPAMRAARSGHIFNLSSTAGLRGIEAASLYCSSKFAVEGFSEALGHELAPFGIHVTIVEPGPFRTDFLKPESLQFAAHEVADYDARRGAMRASFEQRNGKQAGDPVKLAEAIVTLSREATPPMRFAAGAMAVAAFDAKLVAMKTELDRWRALGLATDFAA